MIVDVVHPAPVCYVRKGCRNHRGELARISTPVEVETVPEGSVRFVTALASSTSGCTIHEHGDALWRLLDVPAGMERREPVSPAGWFEFLGGGGDPDGPLQRHVLGEVAMSPLAALNRDADAAATTVRPRGGRGDPTDFGAIREMSLDGRAWAALKVGEHLRERTLVTGSRVFLKWSPTVHLPRLGGLPRLVGDRHRMRAGDLLCTPGRAEEVVRAVSGGRAARKVRDPWEGYAADVTALSGYGEGTEDLRVLANWLPEEACRRLIDMRLGVHSQRVAREANAAFMALRDFLVPASLGALEGEAMQEAMELLRDAAILLVGGPGGRSGARGVDPAAEPERAWEPAWEGIACMMEAGLMRLTPAPEDEDAMAELGMHP